MNKGLTFGFSNFLRKVFIKVMFLNKNKMYSSQKSIVGFRLWLIVIMTTKLSSASFFGAVLPCSFYDSINITDGSVHSNGSITFKGIEFPPNQNAKVVYMLEDEKTRLRVNPYTRGCLCNIRSCIKQCCNYGWVADERDPKNDVKCIENKTAGNISSETILIGYNNQTNQLSFAKTMCAEQLDDRRSTTYAIISYGE